MTKKELQEENDRMAGLIADMVVEINDLTNALKEIHKRSVHVISKDPDVNRDTLFLVKIEEIASNALGGIK